MSEFTMGPMLLNLVLWLPIIGVGLVLLAARANDGLSRTIAAAVMTVQFVLTTCAVLQLRRYRGRPAVRDPAAVDRRTGACHYQIGLDGYNILLVLLTAFLGPLVVAGAFSAITKDVKLFHAMVLLIQFAMMGTFLAQDLFLFYVFWETMLIPMFLMIGIWGGERRIYATLKFVLYTAFGSILMLAAVIYLVQSLAADQRRRCRSPSPTCIKTQLPLTVQTMAAGGLRADRSRSRCRWCRCTPGCPTRTSRRPRRAR